MLHLIAWQLCILTFFAIGRPCRRWNPIHTVETIVISVISMLSDPTDESPANLDAAKEFRWDSLPQCTTGLGQMHSSPESISTTSTYIEIRRRRTHTPASRLYTCRRAYVHVLYQFDLI